MCDRVFDDPVEKVTAEHLTIPDDDKVQELCHYINAESRNPKLALSSIRKRLNHRDPHVMMLALSVLDSCWSNCGPQFRKEVSSANFISELTSKATCNMRPIAEKTCALVKKWAEGECKTDASLSRIKTMYRNLIADGYSFDTAELKKNVGISNDPNVVHSQEEEDAIAKAAALSLTEEKKAKRYNTRKVLKLDLLPNADTKQRINSIYDCCSHLLIPKTEEESVRVLGDIRTIATSTLKMVPLSSIDSGPLREMSNPLRRLIAAVQKFHVNIYAVDPTFTIGDKTFHASSQQRLQFESSHRELSVYDREHALYWLHAWSNENCTNLETFVCSLYTFLSCRICRKFNTLPSAVYNSFEIQLLRLLRVINGEPHILDYVTKNEYNDAIQSAVRDGWEVKGADTFSRLAEYLVHFKGEEGIENWKCYVDPTSDLLYTREKAAPVIYSASRSGRELAVHLRDKTVVHSPPAIRYVAADANIANLKWNGVNWTATFMKSDGTTSSFPVEGVYIGAYDFPNAWLDSSIRSSNADAIRGSGTARQAENTTHAINNTPVQQRDTVGTGSDDYGSDGSEARHIVGQAPIERMTSTADEHHDAVFENAEIADLHPILVFLFQFLGLYSVLHALGVI